MKTFTVMVAAITLGLLATPAAAQFGKRGGEGPKSEQKDPKKAAAEDKAYKSALERIPDPKEKYDPWGGVVPADSAKKPKAGQARDAH